MNNRPVINLKSYETRFAQFDSLMRFRIKNILFVASLYDAYILEEDGQLAELVSSRFVELNLSLAPHVKRATTGLEALNLLRGNSYDLVIVFRGLSDIDLASFATESKKINPDIPVALLAFHARELEVLEYNFPAGAIDKAFFWTGDVNIVLTIVKHFEDKRNVDHDTKLLGVRVIIVIEDSVRFYSAYLPQIYSEILSQTRALMADGLNQADKILRMRARPKILLADNFEEGWEMFLRYKKYLLGVISDVRYVRDGKLDDTAGMAFAKLARLEIPDLPILLQSSDPMYKGLAQTAGTAFLNKNAPNLLGRLRTFIKNNFGFGAFVFRMPDGAEVGRAEDFYEMEQALQKIPAESIIYHANRNHFSNWLMARTEFDLAARIRPRTVSEFKTPEALRSFLIESFKGFRRAQQAGIVTDFRRDQFEGDAAFLRIGEGSLGGKGRGLAFINSLMSRYKVFDAFEGFRVSVPRSTVIATSVFDDFMEANDLYDFALEDNNDADIAAAFLKAKMPKDTLNDLKTYLESTKYPLAVRSSSLLEDSHYQPFAGIFITHMLPNNHDNIKIRLKRLEEAIKYTYASIYFRNSKNYIETTGNRVEEEKMAVILQKVVGAEREGAYYPVFSGIARSFNFYPVGNMKPDEGVAYIALGLGKTVVDGSKCLRFSPSRPQVLPQFSTTKDMLTNSQKDFYAIDMTRPDMHPDATGESSLIKLDLKHAEKDGTLKYVGSSYSRQNDRVYDGIGRPGVRIVTFAPILKSRSYAIDEILRFLLQLGTNAMACPVEIEFAAEMSGEAGKKNKFSFLQIRPMGLEMAHEDITLEDMPDERVICRCNQSLSHGRINGLRDIIMIHPDKFNRSNMVKMARQIGKYNQKMKETGRQYMLIGPGRWGSADHWLGIPVVWAEISAARVIVEAAYGDFIVTPSYGTHFFQNIISLNTGYFTITQTFPDNYIDMDWLLEQPYEDQTGSIRHIVLEKPLDIYIDGRDGKAVILKPA